VQYNGHILHANYVSSPSWCKSAFFHQTALPEKVARIANNKEHKASLKSANMKTHLPTPTSKLSVGLQNIININKLSWVTPCLKLYLSHVPLLASFFIAGVLVGLALLIFEDSWSHSDVNYMYTGLLYTLVTSKFTSRP